MNNKQDMVMERKFDMVKVGVSVFVHGMKNQLLSDKVIYDEYINEEGNGVTESFKEWCRPLIGEELPKMISFN